MKLKIQCLLWPILVRRWFASLVLGTGVLLWGATFAIAATHPLLAATQTDSSDIRAFTKWTGLIPRYEMQRQKFAVDCINAACSNLQWERLLARLSGMPVHQQMRDINRFFNAMPYHSDDENYGLSDYWQTPYELMQNGGDCEDYAVAKYLSLRRLGVPDSQLRIVVVKDEQLDGSIHAVLEVRIDGVTYILDNQESKILPVMRVYHYTPMFAINESKWWSYDK